MTETPQAPADEQTAPQEAPEQLGTTEAQPDVAVIAPAAETAEPAVEAEPDVTEAAAPEAAPAAEEPSAAEVVTPAEETPEAEAAPAAEETAEAEAAVEEAPEAEAAPAAEETPEAEDAPPVEETAAAEAAPPVEETAAAEAAPAVEEMPEAEAAPVVEETAAAVETPAADEAPATDPAPAAAAPSPAPSRPRPVPSPAALRRSRPAQRSQTVAPIAPPVDAAAAVAAAGFGRVDGEGTVHVQDGDTERVVGQVPGASAEEALALYVRRYLDLAAKVSLFEQRLTATDLAVKEIDQTLAKLLEETTEPAVVGDLPALRERLTALSSIAAERRAKSEQERIAARAAALATRTQIVEAAESIASTDPRHMQWRPAGEQLRVLLDQWKEAQRSGPRLDRTSEEGLWKRFSHARTAFDRERRHYFAELESRNSAAKTAKEALVARAESLSTSTDWGATAGAYRDLMTEWKSAGRASRRDDDALWARFRAAQDAFFSARDADNAATDEEFQANLVVKEQILTEAEALVPITDLAAAKRTLRRLQDRWDAAGKVPRGDVQRVEGRMRAVETAVRDSEQSAWTRSNPETQARANSALAQLEVAIAGLQDDVDKARTSGDARALARAEEALAARTAWLEQIRRATEG